ncbi:ABC transporter permease [Shewanella cyperi]|uniref:ABC transporter permease n=1 Tax=Shewanella cyperi TaxID=2814292 RepID=UPI001A94777A|nr:ABC transporter permease [Shewanella cyperi]QSX39470.1 ABC transporter permease [Shewanella cyperi]
MSPLNRKLLRDLWRIKGQALAIMLVIALGVMVMVMMTSLINTLEQTRDAYYARFRFADVFVDLVRAPKALAERVRELEGVARAETRVSGGALIDLPQFATPVYGQMISLPDFSEPALNRLYLSGGRLPAPHSGDEVVLLKGFADAWHLLPGDSLPVTIRGKRRTLHVVGIALAPEYVYTTPPGELAPDDGRFAVLWMREKALSQALELEGAFNQLLVRLTPGMQDEGVILALNTLFERYGGRGAFNRDSHFSNRFVRDEIAGLKTSAAVVPPIFLAVAAFLLFIVVSRMLAAEREQIGLLKAFGYSRIQVTMHYVKFLLLIACGGAALGCLFGILEGTRISHMYQLYFKFPFLLFQTEPKAFVIAALVSIGSALAGASLVLWQVFALMPAEAMRPPTPPDHSRTLDLGAWLKHRLDPAAKMVLRNLLRRPKRYLSSVLGIAAGMALCVAMLSTLSGFDGAIDDYFNLNDRSDVTVSFVEPAPYAALFELAHLPGVLAVEPVRQLPVVFRAGLREYRGVLTGLDNKGRGAFYRALDAEGAPVYIRDEGVVLGQSLARVLGLAAGDFVRVELTSEARRELVLPVIRIADTMLGAPAYLSLKGMETKLRDRQRVSGAFLRVDALEVDALYRRLKAMPAVAGVSVRAQTRAAFERMMNEGAGAVRYIMALIAAIISFGVVYNSARISFAEHVRELACLRVLGYSRGQAAYVLLGDMGLATLLALPLGAWGGFYLTKLIAVRFSTELYTIRAVVDPHSYGIAALAVLLAAAVSAWVVRRDLDRTDLVIALKTWE